MSDFTLQARHARTHLMQALSALQLDEVPAQLQAVAAGVAQAMSLLHRIETKGAQAETADEALTLLRAALNQLQAPENEHPTAETALEIVASSLGMVHQLARGLAAQTLTPQSHAYAQVPETQPKAPAVLAPTPVDLAPDAPTPAPLPSPTRHAAELALGKTTDGALGTAATQPLSREKLPTRQVPILPPEPNYEGKAVEGTAGLRDEIERSSSSEDPIPLSRVSSPPTLPSAPPTAIAAPAAAAIAVPEASVPERPPSYGPDPQRISSNPVSLPSLPAQPGEVFVEAALGAYSTTNFFKGLSGNDVIDAGGLFIATYAPPEMGQSVRVHVSLPGGFEFQARGLVTWVREMPKTGSLNPLSPPGYGVKFTEISKEARQLVYRYVRNREPLFHDDF